MTFAIVRQTAEWKTRCESWLAQVLDEERTTAEELLDGIQYISQEDLMHGLQSALNELLNGLSGTTALYPVTNTYALGAFETYTAFPFGKNGDLGSEGDLGHLCRDVCKAHSGSECLAFPCLESIREHRVRHVVLVTDTISSGNQVIQYLNWIWANRTIRSWWSAGFVRFHVLSYLYTERAKDLVQRHPSQPKCNGIQVARRGHRHWPHTERAPIVELCEKYGPGKNVLGFGDQFSLDVFSYSCPNNVPSILRFDHSKTKFQGLFGRRPSEVSGSVVSGPDANLAALNSWLGVRASSIVDLLCFTLMTKPATPEQLSVKLGLPIVSINNSLNASIKAGYVRVSGRAFRLTPEGLRFARSLAEPTGSTIRESTPMGSLYGYIPQKRSPASPSSIAPSTGGGP